MDNKLPSKKQIQKAGSRLRRQLRGELDTNSPEYEWAFEIIGRFRLGHSEPLDATYQGLTSIISPKEFPEVHLSQRLKRWDSIVSKVALQPSLSLDRMQDIAGCRIVLANLNEVWRVRELIYQYFNVVRESDYITAPKSSGYRGIHLVVTDVIPACTFPVEIQLRTSMMHQWAVTVEHLASHSGYDLKRGEGPRVILDVLASLSLILAEQESGDDASPELVARVRNSLEMLKDL